ncbi:MAG: YcaO-like family protein [Planctomycetales bacterium]|nr:YcaO-like family protein [Planctomycetales bacterium]
MNALFESRYTGLVAAMVRVELRPHDPAVAITAGEMPAWFSDESRLGCSGAGWNAEDAELACFGEGVERCLARALPCDESLEAAWATWPLDEPAIDPQGWVLFHPDQYAATGFPFQPLTSDTLCRWACCRMALSGSPIWAPEELIYLNPRRGECQRHAFGFSTGLSCGRWTDPVLLRGAQEVIERDALMGAWWRSYPVEEWPIEVVRKALQPDQWRQVERPNLLYRAYRIHSPFSSHVTMVSLSGTDEEGWVFSVGSACRESRDASWQKSVLEAVQGRHCVRQLLGACMRQEALVADDHVPTTFFEHALHYAIHPEELAKTVLCGAAPPNCGGAVEEPESLELLQDRLGPERPILFRNLTPPHLAAESSNWLVLRVLVPGLQPMHGDHRLPFLGGPLWRPRSVSEWSNIAPHPFA